MATRNHQFSDGIPRFWGRSRVLKSYKTQRNVQTYPGGVLKDFASALRAQEDVMTTLQGPQASFLAFLQLDKEEQNDEPYHEPYSRKLDRLFHMIPLYWLLAVLCDVSDVGKTVPKAPSVIPLPPTVVLDPVFRPLKDWSGFVTNVAALIISQFAVYKATSVDLFHVTNDTALDQAMLLVALNLRIAIAHLRWIFRKFAMRDFDDDLEATLTFVWTTSPHEIRFSRPLHLALAISPLVLLIPTRLVVHSNADPNTLLANANGSPPRPTALVAVEAALWRALFHAATSPASELEAIRAFFSAIQGSSSQLLSLSEDTRSFFDRFSSNSSHEDRAPEQSLYSKHLPEIYVPLPSPDPSHPLTSFCSRYDHYDYSLIGDEDMTVPAWVPMPLMFRKKLSVIYTGPLPTTSVLSTVSINKEIDVDVGIHPRTGRPALVYQRYRQLFPLSKWARPKHPQANSQRPLLVVISGAHAGKFVRRYRSEPRTFKTVVTDRSGEKEVLTLEFINVEAYQLCVCPETPESKRVADELIQQMRIRESKKAPS